MMKGSSWNMKQRLDREKATGCRISHFTLGNSSKAPQHVPNTNIVIIKEITHES